MSRADDQRLADIVDASVELAAIIQVGRARFDQELVLQRASERLLEIIGEAANALTVEARAALPDIAWADIARLRILLAHHYHRVDAAQVWVIAEQDVPAMVAAIAMQRPDIGRPDDGS